MDELLEVKVEESALDFHSGQYRVVLRDVHSDRILSIWVGHFEGSAISLGLEESWTPRPMTHDLILKFLIDLKADVEQIVITDLKDNTFYAEITVKAGEYTHIIDSRPSDAIAIAVRTKCPVFVSKKLADSMSDELDEIFDRMQPDGTVH